MRTPDELRLSQIAKFFDVSVEYLRRDHAIRESAPGIEDHPYRIPYSQLPPPTLQEPDAPPYGLPPLRRGDRQEPADKVAELAAVSSRLLGMISTIVKGVAENEYDIGNTITVLRTFGFYLNEKLSEAGNTSRGSAAADH